MRPTEREAQLNLRTMLELCAAGEVRCSEKTGRPSASTIRTVSSSLADIEEIKGQRIRNVLSAAKPRRQIVAKALAGCPADEWIGVDGLFTTMRRENLNPTIARNDHALWKLYLVDPQYSSLGYDGFHKWAEPRTSCPARWIPSSTTSAGAPAS